MSNNLPSIQILLNFITVMEEINLNRIQRKLSPAEYFIWEQQLEKYEYIKSS